MCKISQVYFFTASIHTQLFVRPTCIELPVVLILISILTWRQSRQYLRSIINRNTNKLILRIVFSYLYVRKSINSSVKLICSLRRALFVKKSVLKSYAPSQSSNTTSKTFEMFVGEKHQSSEEVL